MRSSKRAGLSLGRWRLGWRLAQQHPSDTPCRKPPLRVAHGAYRAREDAPPHYNPMKIIKLLHVVVAQAFYKWAMREINPMHPDVPRIMLRQQELAEKYRRIWA